MVCAADPADCLRDDVLRFAGRVTPDAIGQGYSCRCPAHDDKQPSLHVEPGDKVRIVYFCRAGCQSWEIYEAFRNDGVSPECLGSYGRSQYRKQNEGDALKLRQVRAYLAGGCPSRAGDLRLGLLAVLDGGEIPAGKDDFLAFAERAGICRSDGYRLWAKRSQLSSG